jgi:hypothetical protein
METWMNFALVALLMLVVTNLIYANDDLETTLFTRLGGHSGIENIVKQFVQYMQTSFHFNKVDSEFSSERFYQHLVDFLCDQTGGPASYLGSSLELFTDSILIGDADWILICCIFEETLRDQEVSESDIQNLVTIFIKLRVLEQPMNQKISSQKSFVSKDSDFNLKVAR